MLQEPLLELTVSPAWKRYPGPTERRTRAHLCKLRLRAILTGGKAPRRMASPSPGECGRMRGRPALPLPASVPTLDPVGPCPVLQRAMDARTGQGHGAGGTSGLDDRRWLRGA